MKISKEHLELLGILQEESAEIIVSASKVRRFGWDSCHPDKPNFSNKEHLEEEIGDLLCIIRLMCDKGIIDIGNVSRCAEFKLDKLRKYSNIKVD